MMLQIIKSEFQNSEIDFREDGWFNATVAAAKFGKEPTAWLRQQDTVEYIAVLSESIFFNSGFVTEFNEINKLDSTKSTTRTKLLNLVKSTGLVKVKSGATEIGGGAWLHPKLAVRFAQWLDMRFAIWCDIQIDNILRNKHPHFDHKRLRHEAASSFKVMTAILQYSRLESGKDTKPYHYSNEALLINQVLSGKRESVDRDSLSTQELFFIAKLEERNSVLIGRGVSFQDRKKMLEQMLLDLKTEHILKTEHKHILKIAA